MVRTVLVQTYHRYTQFTHVHPLGIMMIAAQARVSGFADVHILDMKVEDWDPERCVEELVKLAPDVIGLSAMTYEAGCMHEVAKLAKARLPKAVIVCGGPHPSVAADDVMKDPNVDLVVRGEGEFIFADVLAGVRDGRTDWSDCLGISWRKNGAVVNEPDRSPPQKLDEMPFPAWDLIDHAKYHTVPRGGVIYAHKEFATMFSSRACPWRCTYCHNSYGKTFRERSAEHVLAEIDLLVTKYGVKELVFMDDIFNFKAERAKTIARGIIERGYKLALTFPNGFRGDILDEELVVLLKQAGMYRCMVAVESASPRIQKEKRAPQDRQGRAHRRLHRQARRDGARRVHARFPERNRRRDAVDDSLGRALELPHRGFLPRDPLQGHRAVHAGRARRLQPAHRLVGLRALPDRDQPLWRRRSRRSPSCARTPTGASTSTRGACGGSSA